MVRINYDDLLRNAAMVEVAFFTWLVVTLTQLSPSQASYFRLYELLGVATAAIITTFGIYGMKQLT